MDYSNCKCRKKLIDPLVDEYTKTIEEAKIANITIEDDNSYCKCSSCKMYIASMIVVFTFFTGITIYFVYCMYVKHNKYDLPY